MHLPSAGSQLWYNSSVERIRFCMLFYVQSERCQGTVFVYVCACPSVVAFDDFETRNAKGRVSSFGGRSMAPLNTPTICRHFKVLRTETHFSCTPVGSGNNRRRIQEDHGVRIYLSLTINSRFHMQQRNDKSYRKRNDISTRRTTLQNSERKIHRFC